MIRLYFNKRGERPWSIDEGPGTLERTFKTAIVTAFGVSKYTGETPNENSPVAWIEYPHAIVMERRDAVVIRSSAPAKP